MPFQTPIDIANQALQDLGQTYITTFQDNSRQAKECNTAYDNARIAELSNHTWMFSIRKARVRGITQSMQLWTPPTYNPATAYTIGQVVMYAGGTYANSASYPWIMQVPSATGAQPDISSQWSHYFGTLAADVFDNQATYAAGEVVLVPEVWNTGNTYPNAAIINYQGTFYVSLAAGNAANNPASTVGTWWAVWVSPETATLPTVGSPAPAPQGTYASGTTYAAGAIVSYTSLVTGNVQYYISLSGSNTGNEPDTSPTHWSLWGSSTSQGLNSPIGPFTWTSFEGGVLIYLSLTNSNGSTNPSVTPNMMPFSGSPNWTLVGGTIQQFTVLWPVGSSFLNEPNSTNLFKLPYGWLRPNDFEQQPGDTHPWLGAFYGTYPKDFVYYDEYFSSFGQGPWDVQFVADIADVTRMHPQFCHCVALNMAQVMDEPLTQGKNAAKLVQSYSMRVRDAQRVDAMTQGTPDEPLEEFLRVRL